MSKQEELKKMTIPQLKAIIKRSKIKGITGKNKAGLIKMIIDNNIKYTAEKALTEKIAKMLPKKPRANNKQSAQKQADDAIALMKKALGAEAKSKARVDDMFQFTRQRKKKTFSKYVESVASPPSNTYV